MQSSHDTVEQISTGWWFYIILDNFERWNLTYLKCLKCLKPPRRATIRVLFRLLTGFHLHLPLECSPQKLYPHSVRGLEYSGARAKAAKALVFWFSGNDQKAKQWVANSLENPWLEQIPSLVGFVCTVYPRMYIFVCKYIASQLPLYFYLWKFNPFLPAYILVVPHFLLVDVGWLLICSQ